MFSWRILLRIFAVIAWLASIAWFFSEPSYEPFITFLSGSTTFVLSFLGKEEFTLDQEQNTKYNPNFYSHRKKGQIPYQFPTNTSINTKGFNPNITWGNIHWLWWAVYISIGFGLSMCPFLYSLDVGFIFILILFVIIIPALTIWIALTHPIPLKYAFSFIVLLHLAMVILSATSGMYTDIYQDIPYGAWAIGNIGAVIVISIQRQQIAA
jgi:hypothetical protein